MSTIQNIKEMEFKCRFSKEILILNKTDKEITYYVGLDERMKVALASMIGKKKEEIRLTSKLTVSYEDIEAIGKTEGNVSGVVEYLRRGVFPNGRLWYTNYENGMMFINTNDDIGGSDNYNSYTGNVFKKTISWKESWASAVKATNNLPYAAIIKIKINEEISN